MSTETPIFIMPTPATGDSGPVAAWISIGQWSAAARRIYGDARVISPEGTLSPEEALSLASAPTLAPKAHSRLRKRLPVSVETAAKDVRSFLRGRNFRRSLNGDIPASSVAFVWQYHYLFQDAGLELARRLDTPLVLRVNAPQVWEARRWGVRRPLWGGLVESLGEKPQLLGADILACVSAEVADVVASRFGRRNGIVVTPNGVDPERFSPEISGTRVRQKYGLEGKFVVGWAGSFRPFHDLEIALDALAKLTPRLPELSLLLVGDGQTRRRLEGLAAEMGLSNVTFTGTVEFKDMPEYIAAMDVALLPGKAGSGFHYSPVKLWEYMAAGRPVIAAAVGQVSAVLDHGVTGLLTTPGDAAEVVTAIEDLYDNSPKRADIGSRARQKVEQEWTWDLQLRRVLDALN